MYFDFNFLSYSLVCRSKLFEIVIWFQMACEVIHEWLIKPNGIVRSHTLLSFYEFEECLKNVCSYALKIHTIDVQYLSQ